MAKGKRVCKICGIEYPYCATNAPTGRFRWQDVACSIEHGDAYFRKVAESRGEDYTSILGEDKKAEIDEETNEEEQEPVEVKPRTLRTKISQKKN